MPRAPRVKAKSLTMPRVASCFLAASLGLTASCGRTEGPASASSNQAGGDGGGRSFGVDGASYTFEGDAGAAGFSVNIEAGQVILTSATVNCAGDCIDVQAVAQGGVPPYTYTWSDGTTGATRRLCPTSSAMVSVSVTDAGVTGGEFARPPQTTKATFTVEVLSCSDATASSPEAGDTGATSDGSVIGCGSGSGNGSGPDLVTSSSCQKSGAGLTNCGASSESCCTSIEVTGGTYLRTYASSGSGNTGDPATVSCFRLDKYEVTVGRFRQFVNAWNGGWLPPAGSGKHTHLNGGLGLADSANQGVYESGWVTSENSNVAPTNANLACYGNNAVNSQLWTSYPTWTGSAGSNENLPINCVNWYEAYAFCIWDGGFLPSMAEWEYAAAGGSEQREYPWGSTDPGTGNRYAIYGCDYPNGSGICATGVANMAPVGTATLGAGLWGQLDLAGSVSEWNLDRDPTYVDPCTDCAYLTEKSPSSRDMRGGYFADAKSSLLPALRASVGSTARSDSFGFRCSRTP